MIWLILVARQKLSQPEVENAKIAIPGVLTTANFLLGLAYPGARDKTPVLFSEIEDSVLNGEYDAGLIIHENRFTYEQKGLIKIMDLGEFWEESTHTPIPLGGIVVRNDIDKDIQLKINRLIRKSVEYAYAHTNEIMPYIREHAQSMSDAVMMSHINLYVNQFSIDLGETGRNAVKNMFLMASSKQLVSGIKSDFFV